MGIVSATFMTLLGSDKMGQLSSKFPNLIFLKENLAEGVSLFNNLYRVISQSNMEHSEPEWKKASELVKLLSNELQ